MFAPAESTSVPTAAPTAAPSVLKTRPYDNQAIYVFYALMICFACIFTTVLLMKLCAELQNSEFVSDCCVRINARCCACFRQKEAPERCLARVRQTEIIPENDFWCYQENDFDALKPNRAGVSTI
jgi:hypothetical protein